MPVGTAGKALLGTGIMALPCPSPAAPPGSRGPFDPESPMSPTYAWRPQIIATDLKRELILLDPHTQEMFRLNEAGRRIWRTLPAGEETLVAALLDAYDVCRESAAADVRRLLRALGEAGLIEERADADAAQL